MKFVLKTLFLVSVTSAYEASELGALSIRKNLCEIHHDKVVLRLDLTLLNKVNSMFHKSEICLLIDLTKA